MKVGWILAGGWNTPSTRIMALNVIKYLSDNDICNNVILSQPEGYDVRINNIIYPPEDLDFCVFQKVCWGEAVNTMLSMKSKGIKTIYLVDDLTPDYIPMCKEADIIVAGSKVIKDWIRAETGKFALVVPDAYETDRDFYKKNYETDKIKVLWFGTIGHFSQALELKPLVKELGYEFITISSSPAATKIWSLSTIWNDIMDSDIVVIPHLGPISLFERAKGNNRITQTQVLGLPIIVSPIPAYLDLIEQGKTGFICYNNDEEEWLMYLDYLRDISVRKEIGRNARKAVMNKYHISRIAEYWKDILGVNRMKTYDDMTEDCGYESQCKNVK